MVNWQPISINFGQGMDTKTDRKLVVNTKLELLENGIFTEAKRVSKRNGYDAMTMNIVGGGTLAAPRMIKSYSNEILCADSGILYSYSTDLVGWVNKGKYVSTSLNNVKISYNYNARSPSSAVLGDIALFAWSGTPGPSATAGVYASVLDLTTNTFTLADYAVPTSTPSAGGVKVIASVVGTNKLAIFYVNSSNQLVARFLTNTISGSSFGNEVTIATDPVEVNVSGTASFDVVPTTTGAVLSYNQSATYVGTPTDLITLTLDTSGAITHTATIAAAGYVTPVHLVVDSTNGNIWLHWIKNNGGSFTNQSLKYAIYSSTLSVVLATTASEVGALARVRNISALSVSTTSQTIYYSQQSGSSGSLFTYKNTLSSLGVIGTPALVLNGVQTVSRPFTITDSGINATYMWFQYYRANSTQGTMFLVDLADNAVIAKALVNATGSTYLGLNTPMLLSSTKIALATAPGFVQFVTAGTIQYYNGVAMSIIDFNHQDAYQGVNAGEISVLNGGIVSMYDTQPVVELGFNLFPEPVSLSQSTGGSIADGVYEVFATYLWTDAKGNVHESTPSTGVSLTVTGGSGTASIVVTVNPLFLTQKLSSRAPQIYIYRTANAQTTPYFAGVIANDPTQLTQTITLTNADVDTIGSSILYTNSGELQNSAPPPSTIMCLRQNRVWLTDAENPNVSWYSKTILTGNALNFSNLITYQIDSDPGAISGISQMDEKIVFFKNKGIIFLNGDGVNSTGTGSSLSIPQILPTDNGCTYSKSIISLPIGIFFTGAKGKYLLERSLNVKYKGAEVEAYNSQDVTAATLLSSKSQVRFLTSSGNTLLYDYIMDQWSVFTNHEGLSADIWNGTYVYARSNAIYKENTSTFLDNATQFNLKAKTSFLKTAIVQGFQRVRQTGTLGDYTNNASGSHKIQMSVAYDYDTTFSTPIPYTLPGTSGVMEYQTGLPRQKCESLQLFIEEVSSVRIVQTVTLNPDVAGSLNNKYFLLNGANDTNLYFVWFDNGTGVAPVVSGRTAIRVVYSNNASANTLGGLMATAISGAGSAAIFSAANNTGVVTITNLGIGDCDLAVDFNTGFTFAQGTNITYSGEFIDFSDLTLSVGVKTGMNKLAPTKQVG